MSESVSDYQSSESNQSEQASKKFWSEEVRRQNLPELPVCMYVPPRVLVARVRMRMRGSSNG